jgi:hypothetical protein
MIGEDFDHSHSRNNRASRERRASFSFDPDHQRDYVPVDEVKEQLLQANHIRQVRLSLSGEQAISPLLRS